MDGSSADFTIRTADELSAIYPPVSPLAVAKVLPRLEHHCRRFIEFSPLVCLSSAAADGTADVTPRGDAPGFVRVIDDETIAIPDRPGNNRLDTMRNIVTNPNVGLLFFVPGVDEMLRINGTASISIDPALLDSMAVSGKRPRAAIVVKVHEAFLHCGKALKRARIWDSATHVPAGTLPSLGRMIIEQTRPSDITVEAADARIEKSYRETLY